MKIIPPTNVPTWPRKHEPRKAPIVTNKAGFTPVKVRPIPTYDYIP
jgi:hypothetical protein